ncbi:MAG: hypothetical protein AVDCRST_MAG34-567 [uncultured Nocardioidaceae bacterium]|uniref:DUF6603 domain-containing protein n=1 Tax=uncultured Nocardioidaceae bacterium TaxID=253824 RepID=A0A6J4LJP5_9ACTN|nr:MAG: hypothetical protein AVDCRST_MAG34-567 [uncultured Nocardioidaceae bacterium]
MQPTDLLSHLSGLLWPAAQRMVGTLRDPLAPLVEEPGVTDPALQGRLLGRLTDLPTTDPLMALLRTLVGDLPDGPLQWHGWQRGAGAERGVALVLTEGDQRGVLALSPGPVVDVVVIAGADLDYVGPPGDWEVRVRVTSAPGWQATLSQGSSAPVPTGTADVRLTRGPVTVGVPPGPAASCTGLTARFHTEPAQPALVEATVQQFEASVLPEPLQDLLGLGDRATSPVDVSLVADRATGVRFAGHGLRMPMPTSAVSAPGLSIRGFALELSTHAGGLVLRPMFDARAMLPALPVRLMLTGVGVDLPFSVADGAFRVTGVEPRLPRGLDVELTAPLPVSGGGAVKHVEGTTYRGILDVDLGVITVQAMGILELPGPDRPLSFLVLLTAGFPKPGIQLGFGFALEAVGGLLGINRRVDDDRLLRLVTDGNADRVMFPENALARADDILRSLDECFPAQPGQFLVGPMLRLNWGGRIVTVSAAVILELPDPVRVFLLGRVVIAVPDPLLPIVRLQASLLGRFNPEVPQVDLLLSLTGSWIAGISVSGDLYLLVRGGSDPFFVLSAGGFHPQYVRPPGVPALRRVAMDLSGGFLGLRAEAYLALTSNSLQFGAMVHLDATIAECGVEGYLGLDALFVWEPSIAFSVRVQAGVAVLAFGVRLASVALSFTLEGPGAWHAFGTGSISVLFWDVDLDFDVRWGTPPALTAPPPEILDELGPTLRRRESWATDSSSAGRRSLQLTDDAARAVSSGAVALPDARLRLSQNVIPLDFTINRFHRLAVPDQTWRIERVKLRPQDDQPHDTTVKTAFVPGEFRAMTQDQQLGSPASRTLTSGVELTPEALTIGSSGDCREGYETDYAVEDGWFPAPPARPRFILVVPAFGLEAFARPLLAAERLDRWRLVQKTVVGDRPMVAMR